MGVVRMEEYPTNDEFVRAKELALQMIDATSLTPFSIKSLAISLLSAAVMRGHAPDVGAARAGLDDIRSVADNLVVSMWEHETPQ
jgi:hypothetical protein